MHHTSVDPARQAALRRPLLPALLCALLLAACGGGGGGGAAGGGGRVVALGVSSGYEPVTASGGLIYNDGGGDSSGDGGGGGAGGGGGDSGGAGAGAGLGTFRNAKVTVERADRTVVGSAVTDRFGMVSIRNGGDKQPLLITVEGGPDARYWDEALQQELPFPAPEKMHAMVAAKGSGQTLSQNIGITPLTEAAYQYAVAKLGGENAWRTAANIATANQAVAAEFNRFLPSTMVIEDITRLPALARDAGTQVFGTPSKNVTYGLVSAGIVRAAALHNPGTSPGIDLLKQLSADLADGKVDGIGPGSVVLASTAYKPSSLSADMLEGVRQIAAVNGTAQPVITYTLGGSVTGLFGSGLELSAGAAVQGRPANATDFSLGAVLVTGSVYEVKVKTQPAGQVCSVTNGTGTTGTANVGNVAVTCVTPPPPSFSVAGSVAGLTGSGLVVQTNGGNNLAVSTNGPATFAAALPAGGNFSVTVLTQPAGQICSVSGGSGTLTANVTNVAVTCADIPPSTFTLGGTVTGLAGSGLVLRNNGGSDLSVTDGGGFTFAAPVAAGSAYSVTVAAQPSNPSQTCVVSAGSGTATGNVGSVSIACTTSSFSVGGTVSGLSGSGLVLQNIGGDSLAVSAAGAFTFATPVASGSAYGVTVASQPTGENCSVSAGAGTVVAANVSNVAITCAVIPPSTYTIGGTVAGLAGSGLVLQYNGANNQDVGSSGGFTFKTPIAAGADYAVTVAAQPNNPTQTCVVGSGSGNATANVVNVSVTCTTNTYAVGGTVSGLSGGGLVLQNNGTSNLSVGANGTFAFATRVASGAAYGVTILVQPSGQICAVGSGAGSIVAADVTNVAITCSTLVADPVLGGTVSGLVGSGLVLQNNGGSNLGVSANGSFTFGQVANGSVYFVTVATQPSNPAQTCVVNNGSGTATSNVTNVAVTCTTTTFTVGGTVSGASVSGLVLQNNGEDNLAIAANGPFTFATPVANGSAYGVTIISQPPGQICNVTNGTGTVGLANVTGVTVTCVAIPVPAVTIGGTVSGLAGTGLVLQNNSVDPLPVGSNGGFTFATPIPIGTSFNVSVRTQPSNPTQTCVVGNATGQPSSNVNNVSVTCTTNTFNVSGTVAGLAGTGLVLVNNGTNNLAVGANGNVTFTTPVASGTAYNVTVLTQPTNPFQACTVTNGSGTMGAANVVNVSVNCANQSARYAYVTNRGDNTVSSYAVDTVSGRLKFIDKVAAGSEPNAVTVDPSQRFAYLVNFGSATVSQFTVGTDGRLVPMSPATVNVDVSPESIAIDPSGRFAYVANGGFGVISQFTISANGTLVPIAGAATVAAGGVYPISIAVHPNGKFAYVANANSSTVAQFAIGANGGLTPLATATVPAGTNPFRISVDPTGRFAYTANANGSSLSQYTIGADGALTPNGAGRDVATGQTPNTVTVDPSGRFAYAAIYGLGTVAQFTIGSGGALTPIASAPSVVAGFGPAYVRTDPSGKFAYVVNGLSNDISQYTIGPDGGLLPNALVSIAASGSGPSSMAFSSGASASVAVPKFAYASNEGGNSVSQYTVSANGTLAANGGAVPTGSRPQAVKVDPSGRYAYVANYDGGISQYTIGATGTLTAMSTASVPAGTGPYTVVVHPSGRFAYVPNYGGNNISQFAVGPSGGLLAMSQLTVPAGVLPISVTIDPSGRFAYVANYTGNDSGGNPLPGSVSQYTIGANGTLSAMNPALVPVGKSPRSVTVDPTGRYAYVANFNDNTVSQFAIGASGSLTAMSQATVPAGTSPTFIAVDPAGKYAYAVGTNSNNVSQFAIGPTGGLAAIASPVLAGASPCEITVDPSGKYVYVANYGSANVSMFSINPNGTLSPLVSTVPSGTVAAGTNPTSITAIGSWQ